MTAVPSGIIEREVCVLGAGPGGAAAALSLAEEGVPSVVVDRAFFPRDKVCGDAFSGKVVEVLRRLDPAILSELRARPFQAGSWGIKLMSPGGYELSIPHPGRRDPSREPPGFLAPRRAFDEFLIRAVAKRGELTLLEGFEARTFRREDGVWIAGERHGGREVRARLIVAADGANSLFARTWGGVRLDAHHHYAGVRAYYEGVVGLEEDCLVELHFLRELLPGYLWIFPLPEGRANIGLAVPAGRPAGRRPGLKRLLEDLLGTHPVFSQRLKNARRIGAIRGCGLPLGSRRVGISGEGYLLVGDAASLIDPLTGEGIGNAMISGGLAGKHAARALRSGDVSAASLASYENEVWETLGRELRLSARLQRLVARPKLFDFLARRAGRSPALREMLTLMFDDLDVRARLRNPLFYLRLLLGR